MDLEVGNLYRFRNFGSYEYVGIFMGYYNGWPHFIENGRISYFWNVNNIIKLS